MLQCTVKKKSLALLADYFVVTEMAWEHLRSWDLRFVISGELSSLLITLMFFLYFLFEI